jgi:hypothetical protein
LYPVISRSPSITVPLRTGHSPSTAFNSVLLPAPFGPMIPTNSPWLTTRLQPLRMSTSGM